MTAGHRYFIHWYHHYTDTVSSLDIVLHSTLTAVIACTITEILHGLLLHIYVPLVHGYTNARITAFHILLSSLHGFSAYHCHTCMYGFSILVRWIIVQIACLIVACILMYSCYMIVSRYFYWYDCYWYSRYWIHEPLICDVWNLTSNVPVSR